MVCRRDSFEKFNLHVFIRVNGYNFKILTKNKKYIDNLKDYCRLSSLKTFDLEGCLNKFWVNLFSNSFIECLFFSESSNLNPPLGIKIVVINDRKMLLTCDISWKSRYCS